ncbi:hypothetical protein LTR70_010690 [Exophiala xenobiotica]|uniref:Enoyl reductase (ER) domain-containing protein n=1 Tax=Lithohypha guttulata TaxID=1690604 RepID=A0ABR0JUZ7_9EURO|nr:hypothetical protein LTR24_010673 [Lithohypha guttulata]KAK5308991.1 hypothetical protein LTR70_010690 [Exophiala xenobiotica]
MAPTRTAQWIVDGKNGFDNLKLEPSADIPILGDHDCLVQVEAVSLNYRDLIIPKGQYPLPVKLPVVPGSDACGTVLSTGSRVSRFSTGDRVCTLFNQGHLAGSLDPKSLGTGLGGNLNGTLRQFAVFEEDGLVLAPKNLSQTESSTLTCAALTAWNALYGLRSLKPGEWVLTQGTGGVSIAAIQFALAAGATVIATTSSDAKAQKLRGLGVQHIINYTKIPNWGEEAKKVTPGGMGVHHIVEVGGALTAAQSLRAISIDGVISVVEFLSGPVVANQPTLLDTLTSICVVRGLIVGSRFQFEEMIKAIEINDIRPLIDEKVFDFQEVRETYQYMWDQKHFGKVVVRIC